MLMIMIKIFNRYAIVAACVYLIACSSVNVVTDYDHSASFDRYKTYSLVPSTDQLPLSPSGEGALRDSLRTHLGSRGLTEVSENADIHVVRHVSTKEKVTVHQSPGVPYPYGRYGMWAGAPSMYTDVTQYTEGTLILDFVDAKTQKLVFRGTITGTVGKPETNAERIREGVEKIVQDYPAAVAQ